MILKIHKILYNIKDVFLDVDVMRSNRVRLEKYVCCDPDSNTCSFGQEVNVQRKAGPSYNLLSIHINQYSLRTKLRAKELNVFYILNMLSWSIDEKTVDFFTL